MANEKSQDLFTLKMLLIAQLGFATLGELTLFTQQSKEKADDDLFAHLLEAEILSSMQKDALEKILAMILKANDHDVSAALREVRAIGAGRQAPRDGRTIARNVDTPDLQTPVKTIAVDQTEVTEESVNRYLYGPKRVPEKEWAEEIGRGGLARVLIAFDSHLGRKVAVKELLPDYLTATAETRRRMLGRFLREARIVGQLEHPGIVPVYELGRRKNGRYYFTMQLVRGRTTMADALTGCQNLSERLDYLKHFVDVCQAIAYAHSRGVIHRDIKPQNIMLGRFGETIVLDWGMAKIIGRRDPSTASPTDKVRQHPEADPFKTMAGTPVGTPAYMSPEQAIGDIAEIDERSDIWALGAVLYQILTGEAPYAASSGLKSLGLARMETVAPVREKEPAAPATLTAIAEKALRRDKGDRYSSAKELADEVAAYMAGKRIDAAELSSRDLFKRFATRNKWLVRTTAAVLLISLLVFFFTLNSRRQGLLRESEAHLALAVALHDKAEAILEQGDYSAAKIYAAAALLYNPCCPNSPYLHCPSDWPNATRSRELLAASAERFKKAGVLAPKNDAAAVADNPDSPLENLFPQTLLEQAETEAALRLDLLSLRLLPSTE